METKKPLFIAFTTQKGGVGKSVRFECGGGRLR